MRFSSNDQGTSVSSGGAVQIKLTIEQGRPGIDDDLSNPVARAVHRLLSDGEPLHRLHVSFFDAGFEGGLRWIGAFVLPPSFLYFGFVVGPPGFDPILDVEQLKLGLPADTPYVQVRQSNFGEQSGFNIFRLELNSPLEIQLIVALLPGSMTLPIAFTSGAKLQ